jgi:DNA invertase Pin-like site-specific DNA recombinase
MDCLSSPRRAAIYLRTASAKTDGVVSLEVQRERCHAYAQEHGYAVVATVEDIGRSGTQLDRPGMNKLRELAQAGSLDVVIVVSVDRLARDYVDQTMLKQEFAQAGATVQIVNADQEDYTRTYRLPMTVAGVAQLNHDQLAQRLAAGRTAASERRDAATAQASDPASVRYVFTHYTRGGGVGPLSGAAIAERLNLAADEQTLRVALYVRAVSVTERVDQLAVLRAAAKSCGWRVARTIGSLSSGRSLDHVDMWALRDTVHSGAIDVVLVTALDRLARSVRDRELLRQELVAARCAIVVAEMRTIV